MTLRFNEIELKRITLSDIELLRKWRIDPKISKKMFFREYITEEMQLNWFQNLNETDFYFIIKKNNNSIGLINLNEEGNQIAQVGLFIYDDKYWGGPIPVFASLALLQFAFEERKLNNVYAQVLTENILAQKYNKNLGFSEIENCRQNLDITNYLTTTQKLIHKIKKG